jgi:hypothetical protein
MRSRIPVFAMIGVCLYLSVTLTAEEKYQAMLLTRGGPNSDPVLKIRIIIDSYTTNEEAWQLLQTLDQAGYDQFLSLFRRAKKGSMIFMSTRGLKIEFHAAHVIPKEKGKKIMLFTEKQAWETGVSQRLDGRFPFMVVELDLDDKGKGEGKIYENAQITLGGDKATGSAMVEMDSFNSAPKSLFRVQTIKTK